MLIKWWRVGRGWERDAECVCEAQLICLGRLFAALSVSKHCLIALLSAFFFFPCTWSLSQEILTQSRKKKRKKKRRSSANGNWGVGVWNRGRGRYVGWPVSLPKCSHEAGSRLPVTEFQETSGPLFFRGQMTCQNTLPHLCSGAMWNRLELACKFKLASLCSTFFL